MTVMPATPQELAALIDDEQRRQDAHLLVIRALVTDSRALRLVVDMAPKPGLLASLKQRLRGRREEQQSTEDRLRGRIEGALHECKKASLLVDRFAALREALFADLQRLHAVIGDARVAAEAAGKDVVSARVDEAAAEDAGAAVDAAFDAARRRRDQAQQRQEVAERMQERLSVVVVSARGLLDVIETLSADVAGFARAAERELDVLSARARALSVAEDAAAVVDELEKSLLQLSGSLDDVTVFAAAVHDRVAQSTSTRGLSEALEVLVQGAMARRAATAAKERASAG